MEWHAESGDVAISGLTSVSVGQTFQYSIIGGVAPFTASLSGPGSLLTLDQRTLQYSRPWTSGSPTIVVRDFLGKQISITLALASGALQLGGGADPSGLPQFSLMDSSGNLYVVGSTIAPVASSSFNQLGNPGIQSVYIAKINSSGMLQWLDQLSGDVLSTVSATGAKLDSSGNLIVIGTTDGPLPSSTKVAVQDSFIAKINPTGALAWVTEFGATTSSNTTARALLIDPTDNLSVCGDTSGDFGGVHYLKVGGTDTIGNLEAFCARFSNATGAQTWIGQTAGGATNIATWFNSAILKNGTIYLSGNTQSANYNQLGTSGHGSQDMFIAAISSAGASVWIDQWGGGGGSTTTASAIVLDSNNNVDFFASTTGTSGSHLANGATGSSNAVCGQIDPAAGTLNWEKDVSGGTGATISVTAANVDSSNNLYFTASTDTDLSGYGGFSANSFGPGPTLAPAAVLVKIKPDGSQGWLDQLSANGSSCNPSSLLFAKNNQIYFAGTVAGSTGGGQIGSLGNQDVFILNINNDMTLKWGTQIGGGSRGSLTPISILINASDEVFIAGQGFGDLRNGTTYPYFLMGTKGNQDSFVAKILSSGSTSWVNQVGGGGSAVTGTQNILQDLTGATFLFGTAQRMLTGTLLGPSQFYNSYIVKFDPTGVAQ